MEFAEASSMPGRFHSSSRPQAIPEARGNDARKTMGIIAVLLYSLELPEPEFTALFRIGGAFPD